MGIRYSPKITTIVTAGLRQRISHSEESKTQLNGPPIIRALKENHQRILDSRDPHPHITLYHIVKTVNPTTYETFYSKDQPIACGFSLSITESRLDKVLQTRGPEHFQSCLKNIVNIMMSTQQSARKAVFHKFHEPIDLDNSFHDLIHHWSRNYHCGE
jgi:hypothetical protein